MQHRGIARAQLVQMVQRRTAADQVVLADEFEPVGPAWPGLVGRAREIGVMLDPGAKAEALQERNHGNGGEERAAEAALFKRIRAFYFSTLPPALVHSSAVFLCTQPWPLQLF